MYTAPLGASCPSFTNGTRRVGGMGVGGWGEMGRCNGMGGIGWGDVGCEYCEYSERDKSRGWTERDIGV